VVDQRREATKLTSLIKQIPSPSDTTESETLLHHHPTPDNDLNITMNKGPVPIKIRIGSVDHTPSQSVIISGMDGEKGRTRDSTHWAQLNDLTQMIEKVIIGERSNKKNETVGGQPHLKLIAMHPNSQDESEGDHECKFKSFEDQQKRQKKLGPSNLSLSHTIGLREPAETMDIPGKDSGKDINTSSDSYSKPGSDLIINHDGDLEEWKDMYCWMGIKPSINTETKEELLIPSLGCKLSEAL
jgi:hypothetical protein